MPSALLVFLEMRAGKPKNRKDDFMCKYHEGVVVQQGKM